MTNKTSNALLLFFVFFSTASIAQIDKDIKLKDIPQQVKDYIKKTYPELTRLEYYQQIENDTIYYQASFRNKRDKYNLRFLSDGSLHETEIEREFESLPPAVRDNINNDLCRRFSRFSIHKVQEVNPNQKLRYEISLHGKKGNHSGLFELFFDKDGNFISEEEKIMRSILNNSGF